MPLWSARHKHTDLGLTIKHITHTHTHTHTEWSRWRYSHQRGCRCGWWRSCCVFPPPPWCQNPSAPATSPVCGVSPARHNTSLQPRQHDGQTGTDNSAQHFTTNTWTWWHDGHRQLGTTLHYKQVNIMASQAPTSANSGEVKKSFHLAPEFLLATSTGQLPLRSDPCQWYIFFLLLLSFLQLQRCTQSNKHTGSCHRLWQTNFSPPDHWRRFHSKPNDFDEDMLLRGFLCCKYQGAGRKARATITYLEKAVVNDDGDEECGGVGVQRESCTQVNLSGVGVEQQQQRRHRLLRTHYHRTGKI